MVMMGGCKRKKMKIADPDEESSLVKCASKDRKKQVRSSNSAAFAKFMSDVPDQVLLEIFLRLPHGQSVIQCVTVCKRWCSLIISPYSAKYIRSFVRYHLRKQSLDPSYYPAYSTTLLFNHAYWNYGPFYQLPHTTATATARAMAKPYDLSFLDCQDLVVRASHGELLLLTPRHEFRRYFICNTFTRQWIALPEIPRQSVFVYDDSNPFEISDGAYGFALVFDPVDVDDGDGDGDGDDRCSYRVVIIYRSYFYKTMYHCYTAVFNSDTGKWDLSKLALPCHHTVWDYTSQANRRNHELAVSSNGILHWLDGIEGLTSLVVYDPFCPKLQLVCLPSDQFGGILPIHTKYKARLGVVRGRVRLSLMLKIDEANAEAGFDLKIWELDSDPYPSCSWRLVHDLVLKNINGSGQLSVSFVFAFDLTDGDALFLVHGKQIYRYQINQDKYDKLCRIPWNGVTESVVGQPFDTRIRVASSWKVLTLVHPLWPTPQDLCNPRR